MRVFITGGSGFIGTNLVGSLVRHYHEVLNFDPEPPLNKDQSNFWVEGDVLDSDRMVDVFQAWRPTHVVHLAARTDTAAPGVEEYRLNIDGGANLLRIIEESPYVEGIVMTSTQFVCGPGRQPMHDQDFFPHTAYGESKAISEQLTRQARLSCSWTIIRPTNIWGPWHRRYPYQFWEVLRRGLYIHPGRKPVRRAYGYVGNVVHQITSILEAPRDLVNGRIFYVGDEPIELLDWVNGFSKAITGSEARVVPRWLMRLVALAGDGLRLVGIKAPIFSSRYRSMTEDYPVSMEPTFETLGPSPIGLEQGIAETVQWLRQEGFLEVRPDRPPTQSATTTPGDRV